MGGCRFYAILVVALVTTEATTVRQQCRSVTFHKTKQGYRCTTASEIYVIVANIPDHICTHTCMQRQNCSVINYNHVYRYCQLTWEECSGLVVDSDFMVTAMSYPQLMVTESPWFPCFSVTTSHCVRWVTPAHFDGNKGIKGSSGSYVGRVVLPTNVLVGQFYAYSASTRVSRNGTSYESASEAEALHLHPDCSSSWVSYTPGDPIPDNAVIGGYLEDPCLGTPVIDGIVPNSGGDKRCGYYNPQTQLGYMVYEGAAVATEMDILLIHET